MRISVCLGTIVALISIAGFGRLNQAIGQQLENTPRRYVVSLRDNLGDTGNNRHLIRETMRQAFLISARDEFGVQTVDPVLREELPEASPALTILDLELVPKIDTKKNQIPFKLDRIEDDKRIRVHNGTASSTNRLDHMEWMIDTSEAMSRTEFVEALKAAGLEHQPNSWVASAEIPKPAESLINELNIPAQFGVVRLLHSQIRAEGESPERLGALVRAYANLGMLTEFYWTAPTKVMTGRSLVYANRLLRRMPNRAWPLWNRAYAFAIAGWHVEAMLDLEAAEKLAAEEKIEPPQWARLIKAYMLYDPTVLEAEQEPRYATLVDLLYLMANETTDVAIFRQKTIERVLNRSRDAYRAIDDMATFGQLGQRAQYSQESHRVVAENLYEELAKLSDLPKPVLEVCRHRESRLIVPPEEFDLRMRLISALRDAATKTSNRGEPSWDAMATLIEDLNFVHVAHSLSMLKQAYGVPSGALYRQLKPLVENHPRKIIFQYFSDDPADIKAWLPQCGNLNVRNLTYRAGQAIYWWMYSYDHELTENFWSRFHDAEIAYRDHVATYRTMTTASERRKILKDLVNICPNMPFTVAMLLVQQREEPDPKIAEKLTDWEQRYANVPDVLVRLAELHHFEGREADALRIWNRAAEKFPSYQIYADLANLHLSKNDEKAWLATWEKFLNDAPSFGLEHSIVQTNIANRFMSSRRWQEAMPFARQAAQAYSAGGLLVAASCAEGLQDWKTSELFFNADAERYPTQGLELYLYCRRTGKGNLAEARVIAKQTIASRISNETPLPMEFLLYYLLEKDHQEARNLLNSRIKKKPEIPALVLAALFADEQQDFATRDQLLKQTLTDGPIQSADLDAAPDNAVLYLTDLFIKDLAAGGHGDFDVPKLIEIGRTSGFRTTYYYFLGEYLRLHGKPDDASAAWVEAMAEPNIRSYYRTLAGARLVESGKDPETYQKAISEPLDLTQLAKLQPPKLQPQPDSELFAKHHYKYIPASNEVRWSKADRMCRLMGGHLLRINNSEEQDFIAKFCPGKTIWLGGTKKGESWAWDGDEPMEFSNWVEDKGSDEYMLFGPDGKWTTSLRKAEKLKGYVCEWDE